MIDEVGRDEVGEPRSGGVSGSRCFGKRRDWGVLSASLGKRRGEN